MRVSNLAVRCRGTAVNTSVSMPLNSAARPTANKPLTTDVKSTSRWRESDPWTSDWENKSFVLASVDFWSSYKKDNRLYRKSSHQYNYLVFIFSWAIKFVFNWCHLFLLPHFLCKSVKTLLTQSKWCRCTFDRYVGHYNENGNTQNWCDGVQVKLIMSTSCSTT